MYHGVETWVRDPHFSLPFRFETVHRFGWDLAFAVYVRSEGKRRGLTAIPSTGLLRGEVAGYQGSQALWRASQCCRTTVERCWVDPRLGVRIFSRSVSAGFHDQDMRWTIVRRLLHDDILATADRVVGLLVLVLVLVLVYGQMVSRIVSLTVPRGEPDADTGNGFDVPYPGYAGIDAMRVGLVGLSEDRPRLLPHPR